MMNLPKVGDKIPGGRLSHYYAEVEEVNEDHIVIRYNGEVRSVRIALDELHMVMAIAA